MIQSASGAALRAQVKLAVGACAVLRVGAVVLLAALMPWAPTAAQAPPASDGLGQRWVTGALAKAPPPLESTVAGRAFAFRNTVTPDANGKVTPAQAKAWEQQLRGMADYLSERPLLQAPRGFYPAMSGFVGVLAVGHHLQAPARAPLTGALGVQAWAPEAVTVGADGTPKQKPHHLRWLRIELNYLHPPRGEPWMNDAEGGFGAVEIQGTYAGFPLIDDMLVVTRDGRLPYVPVPRERALKAYIRFWTAKLVEIDAMPLQQGRQPGSGPSGSIRSAIQAAEARLATMSAAERAQPARVRDRRAPPEYDGYGIGLVGEGEGHALLAHDEAFFDPAQPRHRVRVATVRELQQLAEVAHGRDQGPGTVDERVALMLFQQVDWQDFARRFVHAR
jgi:hypothetical protein